MYKQVTLGLLYRNHVITTEIGSVITKTISIGPLVINITIDISNLEWSVSATVLGISIGTAKFSKDHPVDISVDVWLAKASVKVSIQGKCVELEVHASTRFNGSVDYGPKPIWCAAHEM
jgi:hypothetical protein